MANKPRLLVHGGAGALMAGSANESATRPALLCALQAGWRVLQQGGAAFDATVAAVVVLEDAGVFTAGKGAVQDTHGDVTLDAAVMNGADQRAGAVACVPWLRNPVLGARLVMEHTKHVLMVGTGATAFLQSQGALFEPPAYFTPAHNAAVRQGTVGAVALDANGELAAATSTGGTAAKLPGRVGDSPLVGAGTYADRACAISATGQGEFFIRSVFAFRVAVGVAQGKSAQQAATEALGHVARLGGEGGAIVLSANGEWWAPFNTQGMFRGVIDEAGARVAIFPDEVL